MSVAFYGDYDTTETVVIPFNTFSSDDPSASVTITNLVAADVEIHKDGGTTQRSSDNGVTVTIDFDTVTGNHIVSIDLSDNSDAGFYAAGSRYQVRVEGTTIDGATINAWVGSFSVGCTLRPTVNGRTLDVTATGAAGIDWGNIENKTTPNDLSATDIQLCDTVTTLTGHIVQTGDTYALANGATGFSAINTDVEAILGDTGTTLPATLTTIEGKVDTVDGIVDNILVDTAVVGALGAGLTAIPWNSAWDAEVQSECTDALNAYDPPTRAELTTDTNSVITQVNANETKIDTIDGIVDSILEDTGTTIPGTITTMQGNVTDILADTNELQADDIPTTLATLVAYLDTEIAAILEDTGTTLPATLSTIDTVVDAIKVVTDALTAAAATKLATSAGTIISAAAATGTLSTTQMTTNLTEATDDHYNGRIIIWTSGVLQNQATDITDYDGATKMLTYTATTEAPSNGDTFIIV